MQHPSIPVAVDNCLIVIISLSCIPDLLVCLISNSSSDYEIHELHQVLLSACYILCYMSPELLNAQKPGHICCYLGWLCWFVMWYI